MSDDPEATAEGLAKVQAELMNLPVGLLFQAIIRLSEGQRAQLGNLLNNHLEMERFERELDDTRLAAAAKIAEMEREAKDRRSKLSDQLRQADNPISAQPAHPLTMPYGNALVNGVSGVGKTLAVNIDPGKTLGILSSKDMADAWKYLTKSGYFHPTPDDRAKAVRKMVHDQKMERERQINEEKLREKLYVFKEK